MMKEIYRKALDKTTLPNESKENLKSLYDKVNEEGKVMSFEKKRSKKPLAFVAAGLVCAIAVGSTFALGQFGDNSNNTNKVGDSKATQSNDNSFVLNVSAAEVNKDDIKSKGEKSNDSEKYSSSLTYTGYSISHEIGNDEATNASSWRYDITLGIKSDGKNIKDITYQVNKGTIYALPSEEELAEDTAEYNSDDDEDVAGKTFTKSYKDLPKDKKVNVRIEDTSSSYSKADQKLFDEGLVESAPMDMYRKAMDTLFKDLQITVTAKFDDGTTKVEKIKTNLTERTLKESMKAYYEEGKNNSEESAEKEVRDYFNDTGYDPDEKVIDLGFEVEK